MSRNVGAADSTHVFWCMTCNGYTVVVQEDDGKTPHIIACRASGFGECEGRAVRNDNPTIDDPAEPTWRLVRADTHAIVSTENRGVEAAITNALILLPIRKEEGAA